jgi:F-type H+-transporting ATPase subunit epsilon
VQAEIISPDKVIFSGEITSISLPGQDGYFQVLNNHAPLISSLQKGEIKIVKSNGETELFNIESGFVEVLKNKITVLV